MYAFIFLWKKFRGVNQTRPWELLTKQAQAWSLPEHTRHEGWLRKVRRWAMHGSPARRIVMFGGFWRSRPVDVSSNGRPCRVAMSWLLQWAGDLRIRSEALLAPQLVSLPASSRIAKARMVLAQNILGCTTVAPKSANPNNGRRAWSDSLHGCDCDSASCHLRCERQLCVDRDFRSGKVAPAGFNFLRNGGLSFA